MLTKQRVLERLDPADRALDPADRGLDPADRALDSADRALDPADRTLDPADRSFYPADHTTLLRLFPLSEERAGIGMALVAGLLGLKFANR